MYCVSLLPGDIDWVEEYEVPRFAHILARGLYIPDETYPFNLELSLKEVAINKDISVPTQIKLELWLNRYGILYNDNFQPKNYEQEQVYDILMKRTKLLPQHNPVS